VEPRSLYPTWRYPLVALVTPVQRHEWGCKVLILDECRVQEKRAKCFGASAKGGNDRVKNSRLAAGSEAEVFICFRHHLKERGCDDVMLTPRKGGASTVMPLCRLKVSSGMSDACYNVSPGARNSRPTLSVKLPE
jgi:hypothetical protein